METVGYAIHAQATEPIRYYCIKCVPVGEEAIELFEIEDGELEHWTTGSYKAPCAGHCGSTIAYTLRYEPVWS